MSKHWKHLPFFDALKPDYGCHVEQAIFCTYSADLGVVLAVLLALSGRDNERGSASKVDVAATIDQMRGRVNVLFQAGRLSCSTQSSPILGILDSFLTSVDYDESKSSWHPKLALVRYSDEKGLQSYRLWVGSKNLSKDLSWDTGLLLASTSGKTGLDIPGIAVLAKGLAVLSHLKKAQRESLVQSISAVKWQPPEGVSVEELQMLLPGKAQFPRDPGGLEKLVVVSPFLDGEAVKYFGRWGSSLTERILVSTRVELSRLAAQTAQPLNGFRCLSLDAPDDEATAPGPLDGIVEGQTADPENETELEVRGLHAKMILACGSAGSTLWLGSTNCTARAFGRNAEILARLAISAEVVAGLDAFLERSFPVDLATLTAPSAQEEEDHKLLEGTRQHIATVWRVEQLAQNSERGPLLVSNNPLPPWPRNIRFEVSLFGCQPVVWKPRQQQLELPRIELHQVTELVQLRLTLGELTCSWIQSAPLSPRPGEERDRAALAFFLGPKAFLLWMRSLLSPALPSEIGDWNEDENPSSLRASSNVTQENWRIAPSLEEILKAWTRSPETIKVVDEQVKRYFPLLKAQIVSTNTNDLEQFLEFQATWQLIRQQLLS